jgi:hypothetical protein
MTTTKDLIEKGFIDTEDEITFRTHADVLRLFGRDDKIFQKAFARHPFEEGVHVWFPMFYDDANNDWENSKREDWETVFERRKFDNEAYLTEQFGAPENHTRILFAKIAPFGRVFYKFKGVYQFDPDLSRKAKKAAYRRVATSAKLNSR